MTALTKCNYKTIAAKVYKNPFFSDDEFEQDLSTLKRVARKIEKFCATGEFNTKLVLNNFVISCNCFGPQLSSMMLFLFSNKNTHSTVFTFLNITVGMSCNLRVNDDLYIEAEKIVLDQGMINKLKEIEGIL